MAQSLDIRFRCAVRVADVVVLSRCARARAHAETPSRCRNVTSLRHVAVRPTTILCGINVVGI